MTASDAEWLAVGRLYNAVAEAEWVVKGSDDHFYGAWYGGSAAEGGHAAFKSMSQQDAAEHLNKLGFHAEESDLETHPENLADIANAATVLAAKYPDVLEAMDVHVEIEHVGVDPRAYARTRSYTYNPAPKSGYMRGQATMMFNGPKFADREGLLAELATNKANGWIAGGNIGHVVFHEFGHVVDSASNHAGSAAKVQAISKYGASDPGEAYAEKFAADLAK